jgi:hypothetical protein
MNQILSIPSQDHGVRIVRMKHASTAAMTALEPVLTELRGLEGIQERKRGVFYRKSTAFLHFHEDPAGLFADLRKPDGEWLRMRVSTAAERRRFVRQAAEILSAK